MSQIIFSARSIAGNLDHAVGNLSFYNLMDRILSEKLYESYYNTLTKSVITFKDFDEFLCHEDGMKVTDSFVFAASLRAVSESKTNPLRARAAAVLENIRTLQALPQVAKELEPAGPAPVAGMASPNPEGRRGKELADNSPLVSDGPNTPSRIIRRIKRDHPEIAAQLERGEFPSARAAGLAAGFIKPSPPTVRLNDPAKAAAAIIKHMGVEWAAQLTAALTDTLTA
jgi:hypothetical protein